MKTHAVSPFVAGHVIPPLLRPLPVIFSLAQHASEHPQIFDRTPHLHREFQEHVNCFIALVETACTSASLPPSDCRTIKEKAQELGAAKTTELIRIIDQLDLELAHFSEVRKNELRQAYTMKPEIFKAVYHTYIKPKKLALVYDAGACDGVPKILETLCERCYYDAKSIDVTYLTVSLRTLDFALFAPCQDPISTNMVDRIREAGMPFLVLVNLGSDIQRADMAQIRLASLYQKNGIPILHRPFPAIRLFHKIDQTIVEKRIATVLADSAPTRRVKENA